MQIQLRHVSQLFTEELVNVNPENQDFPTLDDDKVKLFIPEKKYSKYSNFFPKAIYQSINNDNSENVEVSNVIEITQPDVNFPIKNDFITVSNKSKYRTRSDRISKLPFKLNL